MLPLRTMCLGAMLASCATAQRAEETTPEPPGGVVARRVVVENSSNLLEETVRATVLPALRAGGATVVSSREAASHVLRLSGSYRIDSTLILSLSERRGDKVSEVRMRCGMCTWAHLGRTIRESAIRLADPRPADAPTGPPAARPPADVSQLPALPPPPVVKHAPGYLTAWHAGDDDRAEQLALEELKRAPDASGPKVVLGAARMRPSRLTSIAGPERVIVLRQAAAFFGAACDVHDPEACTLRDDALELAAEIERGRR